MKIAVVGSRDFKDTDEARNIIFEMFEPFGRAEPADLVSGGARGIDQLAEEVIDGLNKEYDAKIKKIIFKPDWNKYGKRAGFLRNELIINEADFVLAFWDGKSKGTKHSIDLAIKKQIPIDIHIRN